MAAMPRAREVAMDMPVLLFTLGISVITGLLFGVVPALRGSNADPNETLKDGSRSTEGRSHASYRSMLITVELALAFSLVMGAALLGKSLLRLLEVNPGYYRHNVLTAGVYVCG